MQKAYEMIMEKKIKDGMVTIRCTKELQKQFKIACVMTDTKASDVIEKAMKEFIENNGGNR